MLEFLAKLLKLQLMERVYDALAAQMELSIYQYDRGLVIKVSGLNHKLHVIYFNMLETYGSTCITYLIQILLDEIVDHLAKFEDNVGTDVFNALKDEQEKALCNKCLKPSKLIV